MAGINTKIELEDGNILEFKTLNSAGKNLLVVTWPEIVIHLGKDIKWKYIL